MPGVGYRSKFPKSGLVPAQQVMYLGMLIDSVAARAFLIEGQTSKFRDSAYSLLSQEASPACMWQVLLGHMSSPEKLVTHGSIRMIASVSAEESLVSLRQSMPTDSHHTTDQGGSGMVAGHQAPAS